MLPMPQSPSTDSRPSLDQSGQGLTEYLILLILVSVISITAVQALGSTIKRKIQTAREHINTEVDLRGE